MPVGISEDCYMKTQTTVAMPNDVALIMLVRFVHPQTNTIFSVLITK